MARLPKRITDSGLPPLPDSLVNDIDLDIVKIYRESLQRHLTERFGNNNDQAKLEYCRDKLRQRGLPREAKRAAWDESVDLIKLQSREA